jgi:carbon monoxide dehydrogenase subunit G
MIFLAIVAVAIVGFVIVVAMQPNDFTIARSAVIPAPPSVVFDEVNDFHKWNAWSPWAKMDPNAKNTFEGEPSGPGSIFSWDGNGKVGAGRMSITENRPGQWIHIKLEFIKPFQATNSVEFTFEPAPAGTKVTWSMSGESKFIGKAIGLLMSCDKMIGTQYEQGLQNLANVAAQKPVAAAV